MLLVGSHLPTQLETEAAFQPCPETLHLAARRGLLKVLNGRSTPENLENITGETGQGQPKRASEGLRVVAHLDQSQPPFKDSGFCSIKSTVLESKESPEIR